MYIAVCDDQTEELKDLTELIGAWEEDRGTPVRVKSFRSAAELLDAARHERFTLYLLDIMMPGLNGMDAAREIRGFDKAADIIFLTSSPGFAYDSYSVKALEYLLKPIRTKTLYPILDRLELRERRPQEALTLRTGGIIVRVPFSQLTSAFLTTGWCCSTACSSAPSSPAAGRIRSRERLFLPLARCF